MKSIKDMFYISELSIFGVCFFLSLSSLCSQNSIGVKMKKKQEKERINNKNKNIITKKKQCATSFSVNIHKK